MAIRPVDGVLCLSTMRYHDEVLLRDGIVPDESAEPSEKERLMARQLVESLAVDEFEPEKFRDEYREELLGLIERKAAGESILAAPTAAPPAKVLVWVGGNLDETMINFGRKTEADVHTITRLVHRADELKQALQCARDRIDIQFEIIQRIHQDRKFFLGVF